MCSRPHMPESYAIWRCYFIKLVACLKPHICIIIAHAIKNFVFNISFFEKKLFHVFLIWGTRKLVILDSFIMKLFCNLKRNVLFIVKKEAIIVKPCLQEFRIQWRMRFLHIDSRAIPCQMDQNFQGWKWPIPDFDETFPDERYIWDMIILKISAQTVISFKSYDNSKLDGKLKIGKTRGDQAARVHFWVSITFFVLYLT